MTSFAATLRRYFGGWQSEGFGKWDVPQGILELEGLDDLSWHNDAGPSFGKIWELPNHESVQIRIYIYQEDPGTEYATEPEMILQVFTTDCDEQVGQAVQDAVAPLIDDATGDPASGTGDNVTTMMITEDVQATVHMFVNTVVTITQTLRALKR